jgi:uncharacterized protein with FMN-binding domain
LARNQRVSGELLILSASAVVAVYAVGYVVTVPGAAAVQQIADQVAPTRVGAQLRDGTYLGEGQSHFGSVFVTVAVAGGRITQVWINAVTTTFPPNAIASLPGAVVERQTPAVDLVSGATASSTAFVSAVRAALQQARG